MRTKLFAILTVVFLLGADAKEDAAKELKKLEGTWKVTSVNVAGKAQPEKEFEGDQMIFKGDKLTLANDKKKGGPEFTVTLDPSKKPKWFDMTDTVMKKTVPCIYSLDGDQVKICIPLVEKGKGAAPKRPASFENKDKPQICFTAKRAK